MTSRWRAGRCSFACVVLSSPAAFAGPLELAARGEFTLVSDSGVKGGGVGPGLELGFPVLEDALLPHSAIVLRAGASALFLSGVVYTLDAGAAFRAFAGKRWEPDAGLYVRCIGGDLVRSIDDDGHLAGNPVALQLGMAPLRFRLQQGTVSFLSVRIGPTLFRSGYPPFALSIGLLEIGTDLRE